MVDSCDFSSQYGNGHSIRLLFIVSVADESTGSCVQHMVLSSESSPEPLQPGINVLACGSSDIGGPPGGGGGIVSSECVLC